MTALLHVVRKEILQLRRDRKMIPVVVMGPILQLLTLGYAANTDVTDVPVVVVDQDASAGSRRLIDRFVSSGYFAVVGNEPSTRSIEPWLVSGRAQLAIVIGPGFGAASSSAGASAGRRASVQVIADGSDSSSAVVGLGYASRIVGEAARERGGGTGATAGPAAPSIDLEPRVGYNPDLRSRWFFVPAVLAMVLMLTTMVLPSMAIVREKEIGTLEQLIVTPIRPHELILGKLLPFAAIGLIDTLLVIALTVFLFGVPLRGSLLLLVGLTGVFLLTTLGLGLLASSLARTQQQAMLVTMFLLMVPMIYLSGLIFPIENMPQPIQYATYLIPLRYYAVILRGIFLKGAGLDVLWPQALALLAFGVSVIALASLRFRKDLD